MNVLFLLGDNYPQAGACTNLLNNLLFKGELKHRIDKCGVLTLRNSFSISDKNLHNEGVTIYKIMMPVNFATRELLSLFPTQPKFCIHGVMHKIIKRVNKKFFHKVIDGKTVSLIGRKLEQIVQNENYDILVPIMGSFDIAAAVVDFKKKHKDATAILYQVDPCLTNYSFSINTLQERQKFEKSMFEVVDRIITTSILCEEAKGKYSNQIIDKMVSLEFPNVVVRANNAATTEERKTINCLFAGNIYGGIRDPGYTLKLFEKLGDITTFNIVGSVAPEHIKEISRYGGCYLGSMSIDDVQNQLKDADILVNIGNAMTNQVPSKLFEYISYGKPIVNICKNRNCTTRSYLNNYSYALNLFEDDDIFDEQVESLRAFITNNAHSRVNPSDIAELYKTCTPEYCAKQMVALFETSLSER